jgi:aminopeptidase N
MVGAALVAAPSSALAQSPTAAIDVIRYEAIVEPDIAAKSVRGTVSITFDPLTDARTVTFDSGSLAIDAVRERGRERRFEQRDRRVTVSLDAAVARRTLVIEYHGSPTRGLLFRAEPPQAFTIFATSEWMPCIDAPGDKATLDLTVVTSAPYTVAGNGWSAGSRAQAGKFRSEYHQDVPMPSYTFGFAVGAFGEATSKAGSVALRALSAGASAEHLEPMFGGIGNAMAFFAERAGVPYPGTSYTTVFAGNGIGQELAGFTILPSSAREALLKDPGATLGLHELAHQWWGNLVTCRDWTHFWLNEGFATFMTAAYLGHAQGREAYTTLVEGWRARYQKLVDAGTDRPLVFPHWNRPTADDRAVVYSKGAYVLSLLREQMGDAAFWKGLRDYTVAFAGKSVVTADFVRVMEESSGQNLSAFASRWIYGMP